MTPTIFNKALIYNIKDKKLLNRIKENMEEYYMCLSDAFDEAARELAKPGTELYKAWQAGDYRRFIPSAYIPKTLDFTEYPLKYELR